VTPLQREKTTLKRGALDNLYLRNNPRVEVAESNAGPTRSTTCWCRGRAAWSAQDRGEGGDFPSRNAGIGFESADRAWDAALKEMRDLGAQYYPEEAKSGGFIPELGVEIHKRDGLYYYDQIARGGNHDI
jgi:hypothetical protein